MNTYNIMEILKTVQGLLDKKSGKLSKRELNIYVIGLLDMYEVLNIHRNG